MGVVGPIYISILVVRDFRKRFPKALLASCLSTQDSAPTTQICVECDSGSCTKTPQTKFQFG